MAGSSVWTWMQSRAMNSKNWLKPAQFYSFLLHVCSTHMQLKAHTSLKAIIQLQAIAQTTSMVNLRKAAWKARAFHPQLCRENGNQQCNEIWNGNHSNLKRGNIAHSFNIATSSCTYYNCTGLHCTEIWNDHDCNKQLEAHTIAHGWVHRQWILKCPKQLLTERGGIGLSSEKPSIQLKFAKTIISTIGFNLLW